MANKSYEQNSVFPNIDWHNVGNLIVDETTEEGRAMAQTIINNYPFFDFEFEGQIVTNVVVLEKPVRPPEVEGKSISLVKNELDQWVYVYEDMELTMEEILRQELAEQKALINAILGVTE